MGKDLFIFQIVKAAKIAISEGLGNPLKILIDHINGRGAGSLSGFGRLGGTGLKFAGGKLLFAFEYPVEIGAILKSALQVNSLYTHIWILQHFCRQFDPFLIDEIHRGNAHFVFEDPEEMGFAQAGLAAQFFDGKGLVQVFTNELNHVGQAIFAAQAHALLRIGFSGIDLQDPDDQFLQHVVYKKVFGWVVFGE